MNRFGAVLTLAVIVAGSACGASPDPRDLVVPPAETARARELIRKLGSGVYRERQQAQADLAKMGRLARPALLEAATSDASPEIRFRCQDLLPRAEADDLKARIDTFLADTENRFDHDLPVWKEYRRVVGSNAQARQLYVEMLKPGPNQSLLVALELPEAEAGRAIADRRLTLYLMINPYATGRQFPTPPTPQQPSLIDVATLLFAECLVDARMIPRAGPFIQISAAMFLQHSASQSALNGSGSPHTESYRRLVAWWLETRVSGDDMRDGNLLNIVMNPPIRTFPETIPLLRRMVLSSGAQQHVRSQALFQLVQRQGKEAQPFLRSLVYTDKEADAERLRLGTNERATSAVIGVPGAILTRADTERRLLTINETVQTVWVGNNPNGQPRQFTCQLRDVAFAMLLIQHGQDLKSYGFELPPGQPNPTTITYANFAFAEDAKRDSGIQKWREYEANPKKPAPSAPKDTPTPAPVPPDRRRR